MAKRSLSADIGSAITTVTGNGLYLSCNASGFPKPDLRWLKDGKPFKEGSEAHNFTSLETSDSGLYTCIADNIAGQGELVTNLTVIGE